MARLTTLIFEGSKNGAISSPQPRWLGEPTLRVGSLGLIFGAVALWEPDSTGCLSIPAAKAVKEEIRIVRKLNVKRRRKERECMVMWMG